jgi:hypothetical protein
MDLNGLLTTDTDWIDVSVPIKLRESGLVKCSEQ